MTQNSEVSLGMMGSAGQTTCSNCHSQMPSDLRFCRNCGFRLTEGMGGYTGIQQTSTDEIGAGRATAIVPRKKRRFGGMSWIFIALLVFFVGAAAFTALVSPKRQSVAGITIPIKKSYIGVDGFNNSDQGVIFESVTVPNGPADKAGLVGGDVIVSFDGHPIQNEDQINDLMESTPIGKTVDIEYSRDGEKKTTKLTTISQDEYRRLGKEFERRPEGRAQFGYEDGEAERVAVPGTKIYGVRLGEILRSRPADIAGVKDGDIVIEFDGIPIRTGEEFLMRVRRAMPYSTVKLTIMRGEGDQLEKLEIPVKMGKQ
jgi:C-terminal processing protease CtpA/Prc/RNA polymerase subunit RPABC4/transcription elongation factor Spt4